MNVKKMIAVTAASVCAAVTFGIESANVVGYVNTELNQGFQPGGSSFAAISGGEYNIQDIKPIAPEGEAAGGWMFYIADMDVGGSTSDQYVYLTTDDGVEKDGWYDANDGETYIEGKSFKLGEGFYFSTDFASDSKFMTSGEVNLNELTISCEQGFCPRANPRPVDIDLQDIKPVPPEGEPAGGWMFYIADMDAGGSTSDQYVYLTEDDGVAEDGWYDANDGETYISGKKFAPGQGFYFSCDYATGGTYFPAIEL